MMHQLDDVDLEEYFCLEDIHRRDKMKDTSWQKRLWNLNVFKQGQQSKTVLIRLRIIQDLIEGGAFEGSTIGALKAFLVNFVEFA